MRTTRTTAAWQASDGRWILLLALLMAAPIAWSQEQAPETDPGQRSGSVHLSDGTTWQGIISLVPGTSLLLHEGTTAHTIDFSQVSVMTMHADAERMERNFLMPEAGKAIREEYGDPYPVRELSVSITMVDGSTHAGHLQTTAMVVDCPATSGNPEDPPQRHKVMLPAKQQGKPGQRMTALVYATAIRFQDHAPVQASAQAVRLAGDDAQELAVLTREDLASIPMTRSGAGVFAAGIALATQPFLAARSALHLDVAWPLPPASGGDDAAVRTALAQGVARAEDFFDERKLLGIWLPPEQSGEAFTLVRLYRRAQSVDNQHPWSVEIWRWHVDAENHVMLAGRGKFFRDLATSDAQLPQVTLRPRWWAMRLVDRVWVVPGSQR